MTTYRLQAAFARKREADHIRTEKTAAVDRYYTHWGKVTAKYENWTTPEYYEQAQENLRKTKEKKEKEKSLEVRREKLRALLTREKIAIEEQLETLQRPKSRNMKLKDMEKIDQNFKGRSEEKRRLELEAKLYGRWRHGVDDEKKLFESKSDNQTLAKLNWLDKQVEDQIKREEEEKIAHERALRMQEEVRKTEEHHKERQVIREKEITQIRALQERHMQELKERDQEAEALKSEANYLQDSLEQLNSELSALDRADSNDFQDTPASHNLRNVKTTIRKRSEIFREQLQSDMDLLRRVNSIYPDDVAAHRLLDKLQKQSEVEKRNLELIEGMYESEAKVNLQQCEEAWRQLNYQRRMDLTSLLKDMQNNLSSKYYENQQRQKDLIDIRGTHLSSIENSNERLKLLIKEQEGPKPLVIETPRTARDVPPKAQQYVSSSFSNLNLDCLAGGDAGSQPQSARSQLVTTPDSQRPKFGRKKVAWM